MPEQDLKLKSSIEGAEQTAAGLKKIEDAQGKVAKGTTEGVRSTEQATEAQVNLNAAEGDFIGSLALVSPGLARVADGLLKFAKIAGEGARAERSLTEFTKKATTALRANVGALKLVGAAGAAALGIWALVSSYRALKEEANLATEAMKKEAEAREQSAKKLRDAARDVREAADERQKIEPLTVPESKEIARRAQALADQFPDIKLEEAKDLLARLSKANVPRGQQRSLVVAQGAGAEDVIPPAGMDDLSVPAFVRRRLNDPELQTKLKAAVDRERFQAREKAQRLREQAQRGGGEDIEELVAVLIAGEERQKETLELLEKAGGTSGGVEAALPGGGVFPHEIGSYDTLRALWMGLTGRKPVRFAPQISQGQFEVGDDIITQGQARDLRLLIMALDGDIRALKVGPSIGTQYNFATDATRQRERESHGQNLGKKLEGG